jgi:hypothetical protein
MDLEGVRKHNPEYLNGIEFELGIYVPQDEAEIEENED